MKVILVRDSYHTASIAGRIRDLLGDKVECYEEDCPGDVKVDIFVLSGRDVLYGSPSATAKLKQTIGADGAKVVATSAMDDFLDRIRSNPALGVDFVIHKGKLVDDLFGGDGYDGETASEFLDKVLASVS